MNRQQQTLAVSTGSLGFILVLFAGGVHADDLRGVDQFLCSSLQATACYADDDCVAVPPAELNIPQFIVVDAKAGQLETTAASGESRETKADWVNRAEERVVLLGYDGGRAFSLIIREATGLATFASAADDRGVIVFAACTPMPRK